MGYYYGVDIGGTEIKVGLFDENIVKIDSFSVKTPKENQDQSVLRCVYDSIIKCNHEHRINIVECLGIGLAVPAPVKNSVVIRGANVKFTDGANLKVELENLFLKPIKVVVANDASVAAYGEYRILKSSQKNIVFYTLGTGIGGGIIVNGNLIEGENGIASEIGHMRITNQNLQCGCGSSGCLEQVCGTEGMIRYTKELLNENNDSVLKNKINNLTPKDIFDAAKENDGLALKVVNNVAKHLAISISTLSVILNPEIFIFGGGISKAGEFLINKIKYFYKQEARFGVDQTPIVLARLGNDAGIYGAAYLVKEA